MNNIIIIHTIVVIVVMVEIEQVENGSFQNQSESPLARKLPRRAGRQGPPLWEGLKPLSTPRGNPKAAGLQRQSLFRARKLELASRARRSASELSESATKELETLAEYMPNLTDVDARTLALRMYYIELSEGISPTNAKRKVSKMFLISSSTVQRWVAAWETTGEEALQDQRSTLKPIDPSLLFACPDLVFELKSWIKDRLKQGGKHEEGYLTIQQLQTYINDVLFKDPDIVPMEVLDMHEARYNSREVSKMTVLRWMHKLGFKWADSSSAPFCDRHEDPDVVAYRQEWVKNMLQLKPRLPVWNDTTGKPEWPNLSVGEIPLFHGNHDESMLYANEGNRFAWVSMDGYHLKPKGDGATIMISGVSVPCHGWLGLQTTEPKTDGSWTHTNVMQNVTRVMDEFEQLYPGCQLLLTYDNAPSHVAKQKGALSTYGMNKSDGGKQPILTQMGWYDTVDAATGTVVRVQQHMWFPGPDGTPVPKGALRICEERGLPNLENMRRDELRALLSSQPDFSSVKPEIQEEVERRGHILLFGPKCHPECMHVELCWAHVKRYCRQHCGHNITTLRTQLQHALSSEYLTVQLHTSFSNHAWKWIEAYSKESNGFEVHETMKAIKKIHQHHRRGVNMQVP